ncbi:tail fiber assembly protein, partial [Escherichia coli]|nr:tail fiber assembly protein [Escherichia coli]
MSHSREAQSLAIQCKDLCASVLSKCSTENIVKSATAENHSILALSKILPANRSAFLHTTWLRLPTLEELMAIAEDRKLSLKAQADSEIAWRQDAVDAGIATDEETAALSEWKKYRV